MAETVLSIPVEIRGVPALLRARWLYHLGAVVMTLIFWGSGLDKLINFANAQQEMAHFGLNPPVLFAVATIIVELGGSLLLVLGGRLAWLGAGALAVFTLATIPIAHRFWEMNGDMAFIEKMVVFEHITVVGGLVLTAIAAELRREQRSRR